MIIIIINVYQWVFVLATGLPITFRTYYTKKFCQETPATNRPEKLERAKNISENIDLRILSDIS